MKKEYVFSWAENTEGKMVHGRKRLPALLDKAQKLW